MPKLTIFVSATIVLILAGASASAAPQNQAPADDTQEQPWPEGPPPEDMQISDAPPVPGPIAKPNARYYTYEQQLTFRVGAGSETNALNELQDTIIGFQYMFPKFLSPKLEAGADLHPDGIGHIHAGARWIWWERGYFRPSVKASLDARLDGKEGLATLGKFENYYARGSSAIEYTVWNPYSLRLEAELLVGSKKGYVEWTLGISRGW